MYCYADCEPLGHYDAFGLKKGGAKSPQLTAGQWLQSLPGNRPYFAIFCSWQDRDGVAGLGHTSVGIFDPSSGELIIVGFYPEAALPPLNFSPGKFDSDANKGFRCARAWPLHPDAYPHAKRLITQPQKNPPQYHPKARNCTHFAASVTEDLGIPFDFPTTGIAVPTVGVSDEDAAETLTPQATGEQLIQWESPGTTLIIQKPGSSRTSS